MYGQMQVLARIQITVNEGSASTLMCLVFKIGYLALMFSNGVNMEIEYSVNQGITAIAESQSIRHQVFEKEQGIPKALDLDGQDGSAFHVMARLNGEVIGTARLVQQGEQGVLARVAVLSHCRGKGVAKQLVNQAIKQARSLKMVSVTIHPHDYLQRFYEAFGFTFIQTDGAVGGHPLVKMALDLKYDDEH